MKYFGIALLIGIIGYAVFAFIGYFLIGIFSSNSLDRGVEASMTCIFVIGPIGFILSFIAGYIRAKNAF